MVGRVQIRYHKEEKGGMTAVTYQKLVNLKAQNCYENLGILWKTSIMFGSPRPAWSGMIMASCGLQEMLELIYAPNAVVHMLSGKAISRGLHGHFIVDAALNALMLKSVLNAPLPCQPEVSENEDPDLAPSDEQCADVGKSLDLDEACTLYEKLMTRDISAEEVCKVDVLTRIKDSLQKYSESVKMSSRTSALWVQYMNMMDILRRYIRAERTGNWALHLQAIQEMLPYLAASGHNHYTKSATVYLQEMSNLKAQHPHACSTTF